MKKTKIIILTVAALLIIALPVLFVIQKTKVKNSPEIPIQEEYKLPDISVVVAKKSGSFIISSGNENRLTIKYQGEKIISEKPFSIHKDTLFMTEKYDPKKNELIMQLELKNIDKLIVEDTAEVYICDLSCSKLEINNNKGQVLFTKLHYNDSKDKNANRIDSFTYVGNKGLCSLKNTQIEHAIIELRNSNLFMLDKLNIKELHLQVKDSSSIIQFTSLRGNIQNMDLDIDKSSYCEIRKR